MLSNREDKMMSGVCPDNHCGAKLFFLHYDASIECSNCGQRYERSHIKDIEEISDPEIIIHSLLRNIILNKVVPKRGADMVLVSGLSNYHCKLLSPFLTKFGMDKTTGIAKPLSAMSQIDTFDCSVLHDRSFLIEPEHLSIVGYGFDVGSMNYLAGTLEQIRMFNNGENRLIPIHSDGDGHCLVHAISRALVGRELFWHPLRCNLKRHIEQNLSRYKDLFKEFVDEREWSAIIDECDPNFIPPDGELLGLRNIHIFGLANILKRPIILLDSVAGMQSLGDYSALFLPALVEPSECRDKDVLNKPLCIAWSSSGRNHYIPLVGIKKASLPKLHKSLVPKAWGTSQSLVDEYMEFDTEGSCCIGGDRTIGDSYILRLAAAMDQVFMDQHGVHPRLVADVHHYVYRRAGVVGIHPQQVVRATFRAVSEKRLYRCMLCSAVCELKMVVPSMLKRTGGLYRLGVEIHGRLQPNKLYSFPMQGIVCTYNSEKDELIPDYNHSKLEKCTWCSGSKLRLINHNGSVVYFNGDQTKTPTKAGLCGCGWKHYWSGKEYDNLPKEFKITLEWKGKEVEETVTWFQSESDPLLNSNAYKIAWDLVQKNFPGEFGTESLAKSVVDRILERTKSPEETPKCLSTSKPSESESSISPPMKLSLPGPKILHKEELGASKLECQLLKKVTTAAPQQQKRQSFYAQNDSMRPKTKKSSPSEKSKDKIEPTSSGIISTLIARNILRVVTSDGRQGSFYLSKTPPTYSELQDWVEKEFDIPCSRQNLKTGVPPKDLYPENDEEFESKPLNLSHGDRVLVEIVKNPAEELLYSLYNYSVKKPMSEEEQAILLAAAIYNQTPWEYSQNHAFMFHKNGLFYREAQSKGLQEGQHYKLNLLPDQVFQYNETMDCLELCLEPHGRFSVSPSVEDEVRRRVEGLKPSGSRASNKLEGPMQTKSKGSILKNQMTMSQPEEPSTIRKGPGFSVLNPVFNNNTNMATEQLQSLVTRIAQQFMDTNRGVSESALNENIDDNSKSVMDTNT